MWQELWQVEASMIGLVVGDRTVGRKVDQLWSFAFGAKLVEEGSLSLRVRKFW